MTTPREPKPARGPTNGRPWPGTRVKIRSSGAEGVVGDYEYGWNSVLFPVVVRFRNQRMTGMFSPDQIIKVRNSVTVIPDPDTSITAHAADTTPNSITGAITGPTPAAPARRRPGAA